MTDIEINHKKVVKLIINENEGHTWLRCIFEDGKSYDTWPLKHGEI